MTIRLVIDETGYGLSREKDGAWIDFARLAKGAGALLPAARPLGAASIEDAIQVAEDWLSPHVKAMRGETLEVSDQTGRLNEGLTNVLGSTERVWNAQSLENVFQVLVNRATRRAVPQELTKRVLFVADIVLVRELVHHGQIDVIRLT